MKHNVQVNLADLLLSVSYTMDLAYPQLSRHQLRSAYIAWKMCEASEIPHELKERFITCTTLHDIGALSPEEKLDIHQFEKFQPYGHCKRGEILVAQIPWLKDTSRIIRYHHRPWEKWDDPISDPDVLGAQIVLLADMLERKIDRDKFILHQDMELRKFISAKAGTIFHQEVVDYFMEASKTESFWLDLVSGNLGAILKQEGPITYSVIDIDKVLKISEIFRTIVDFRSPFTATHSCGVACCASELARMFGFTKKQCLIFELAGNVHDMGKMVIPNSILNKPGPLTKDEFAIMRQHTYVTYSLINSVNGFEEVAAIAAFHHERLNGKGYPFHIQGDDLGIEPRILAMADTFTAMTEDRPYRKRLDKEKVIDELRNMVSLGSYDKTALTLLLDNYDELHETMREKQSAILNFYKEKFSSISNDDEES